MTVNVVLDFDGVLNTFKNQKDPQHGMFFKLDKRGTAHVPGEGLYGRYSIRWSSELLDEMREHIFENENVQVFWLTTWNPHVYHTLYPLLGLSQRDSSAVVGYDMNDTSALAKMRGLSELVSNSETMREQPLVWVDDLMDSFLEADENGELFSTLPKNTLTVASDTDYGVTRPQWDTVKKFLEAHS